MTNEANKKVTKALDAIGDIIDTAHQAKNDGKRHVKKIKQAGKLLGEALDELFKPDTEECGNVEITFDLKDQK